MQRISPLGDFGYLRFHHVRVVGKKSKNISKLLANFKNLVHD